MALFAHKGTALAGPTPGYKTPLADAHKVGLPPDGLVHGINQHEGSYYKVPKTSTHFDGYKSKDVMPSRPVDSLPELAHGH